MIKNFFKLLANILQLSNPSWLKDCLSLDHEREGAEIKSCRNFLKNSLKIKLDQKNMNRFGKKTLMIAEVRHQYDKNFGSGTKMTAAGLGWITETHRVAFVSPIKSPKMVMRIMK